MSILKIAIQNSWPNLSVSAEREFIARFIVAGRALGWTVEEVVTSDNIYALQPDAVIATHEYTPKLTHFPTLGVIWSPIAFFGDDPERIRSILSYDGYLVATPALRRFVGGLLATHGKQAPISSFDFLPTALGDVANVSPPAEPSIFYAGVHWDGDRHSVLFDELYGRQPLSIYGNPEKWAFAGKDYRGTIPFDGRSVATKIAECGITLSLHSAAHRREGVPSMRLFEAASAGALIISDTISFAREHFGDSLLYVDPALDAPSVAAEISRHMDWIRLHPVEAAALAKRSKEIFRSKFTLEAQLAHLPNFVDRVSDSMACAADGDHGMVEIILRVGSRPVEMVRRALQSIADQTYSRIGLILVCFRPVDGLDTMLAEFAPRFERIKRVSVPDNGMRSTALWAGLKAAEGAFLSNLDDDDTIHPTHVASQVHTLVRQIPEPLLVYSGVVERQEESGHWFDAINFSGDIGKTIEERRRLRFLEPYSKDRLLRFDNFIQSNCWMIRTASLTEDILIDPETRVAEDMLLYLLLADRGDFVPTWRVTADWNWRSTSKDNSMFASEQWSDIERVIKRLEQSGIRPMLQEPKPLAAPANIAIKQITEPLTLKSVLRKPSILLGPLAPRWRQFKARRRSKRNGTGER